MGLDAALIDGSVLAWGAAASGIVGASVLDRLFDSGEADDDAVFDDAGGLDGGSGDDSFEAFDEMDEWDDEFGRDDDDGDTGALAGRIDDLEAEVATLSSTVSTVRSENEEIAAAIADTEEDVRSLLDIYEMVTRGINPFVDEPSAFGDDPGQGSFDLFEDDDDEAASLDEDVASADAAGFFDEDLLEGDERDDGDPFGGADPTDDTADDGRVPDDGAPTDDPDAGGPADAAFATDPADEDHAMTDEGKSFSELKAEYDAGEADWAEESATGDESPGDDELAPPDADPDDLSLDVEPVGDDESSEDALEFGEADPEGVDSERDDSEVGDGAFDGAETDERPFDDVGFDDLGAGDDRLGGDPATRPNEVGSRRARGGDPAASSGDGFEYVDNEDLAEHRRKPYLTELPGDYVGDLLVMEWLEFLVAAGDVTDAVRAVNYYERIEWIGPAAADRLREFLSGFGTVDRNLVDRPGTDHLGRDHHTRSLRYITQLNGADSHLLLLDRWDDLVGSPLVGGSQTADANRARRRPPADRAADSRRDGRGR
jgi:flagellar protein FlaE/flagellar protein FlaC